jgi:8-amino-7-oxononanoate synthase
MSDLAAIELRLREWVAHRLGTDLGSVDPDTELTAMGLDSVKAAELIELVAQEHGTELSIEDLFNGLTIGEIVRRADKHEAPDRPQTTIRQSAEPPPAMDFSLFFFASEAQRSATERYRLFLDCAKFADRNGFSAVWSPERHFHTFGGLFPNPSVVGAAVAASTERIRIRAGSVVLPLHDPVRVAEEWAVVDNISGGRVDIAFATGWSPDDFVLAPGEYEVREQRLTEGIGTVRKLWRGGTVSLPNGQGKRIDVRTFPPPVQPDLPVWVTCSGGVERFREAGALGANVITALLFQNMDELHTKIAEYRRARADNGHDPQAGQVTLMLHTFIGTDEQAVRDAVEAPFKEYLADSVRLWRRGSTELDTLPEGQREGVLNYAFERYYRTSALFGTPDSAMAFVRDAARIGVTELACLVDFGLPDADVLRGLASLDEMRQRCAVAPAPGEVARPTEDRAPDAALDTLVRDRHANAREHRGGVLRKARDFDLSGQLRARNLLPFYRPLSGAGPVYAAGGREIIMLGSNDYLGLTADPRVRAAASAAVLAGGTSMSGSRLQNGSTPEHDALEAKLATFLGRADALVFTTGYQANIGLISAVMGEGTVLLVDDECHASVYDGAGVSRCRVVGFRHNDATDLARRLDSCADQPAMVMVDGVYSMSGDLAPLDELRAVCDRYDVPLAVDDAHGLGAVGATGRGIEESAGLPGAADVLTGTFSKSLASIGGWVAADEYLIEWIRYHGRSMIFSAAAPPGALAAADAALDILIDEPERVRRTGALADYWRAELARLGFVVGAGRTAIVPVVIGDDLKCLTFAADLFELGVNVNCVVAPAVPANKALLRTSVMATHEERHLDQALERFATVGRRLGVIM